VTLIKSATREGSPAFGGTINSHHKSDGAAESISNYFR